MAKTSDALYERLLHLKIQWKRIKQYNQQEDRTSLLVIETLMDDLCQEEHRDVSSAELSKYKENDLLGGSDLNRAEEQAKKRKITVALRDVKNTWFSLAQKDAAKYCAYQLFGERHQNADPATYVLSATALLKKTEFSPVTDAVLKSQFSIPERQLKWKVSRCAEWEKHIKGELTWSATLLRSVKTMCNSNLYVVAQKQMIRGYLELMQLHVFSPSTNEMLFILATLLLVKNLSVQKGIPIFSVLSLFSDILLLLMSRCARWLDRKSIMSVTHAKTPLLVLRHLFLLLRLWITTRHSLPFASRYFFLIPWSLQYAVPFIFRLLQRTIEMTLSCMPRLDKAFKLFSENLKLAKLFILVLGISYLTTHFSRRHMIEHIRSGLHKEMDGLLASVEFTTAQQQRLSQLSDPELMRITKIRFFKLNTHPDKNHGQPHTGLSRFNEISDMLDGKHALESSHIEL